MRYKECNIKDNSLSIISSNLYMSNRGKYSKECRRKYK